MDDAVTTTTEPETETEAEEEAAPLSVASSGRQSPPAALKKRFFIVIFLMIAAHVLSETARDGLFLQKLPVTLLPWIYLGIGVVAVVTMRIIAHMPERWRARGALRLLLAASTIISLGFWLLSFRPAPWMLIALYVWPALYGSVVIVEFWRKLSDVYTAAEAKHVYAYVGAGATAGGLFGAAVATAITWFIPAHHLLIAATALFAIAGWQATPIDQPGKSAPDPKPITLGESVRVVWQHPYVFRVALMLVGTAALLTFSDYVFREEAVRHISNRQLPLLFAVSGFAFNVLQLLTQLFVVEFIVRRLSVTRALVVMPSLFAIGGMGIIGGFGLVSAIFLAAMGGTLKGSLQRTATELLYVPMTRRMRTRLKALMDIIGQRGGQAIAALSILGVITLGAGGKIAALAMIVVTLGMIVVALTLRKPYLDLFRESLALEAIETRFQLPTLDPSSMASIYEAFNSPRDADQIAAMDVLAAENRTQAIPVLTLFFPSLNVVEHALDLFVREKRQDFLWAADVLIEQSRDPGIRSAALRASISSKGDPQRVLRALDDEAPEVQATALVAIACGAQIKTTTTTTDVMAKIKAMSGGESRARIALARAIRGAPDPRFEDVLCDLSRATAEASDASRLEIDSEHCEVLAAMACVPSVAFLEYARDRLTSRRTREAARDVFVAVGDDALSFLETILSDDKQLFEVRLHIPRTMSRFGRKAIAMLLAAFSPKVDDAIQYKVLRGLGRIRANDAEATFDASIIADRAEETANAALKFAAWADALRNSTANANANANANAKGSDDGATTTMKPLLLWLLDKYRIRSTENLFRVLGLMHPQENFEQVYRGLRGDRGAWSSGRELVEHAVAMPLRETILSVCDLNNDDRVIPEDLPSPADTIEEILREAHGALRSAAAACATELGLEHVARKLESAATATESAAFNDDSMNAPAPLPPPTPPTRSRQRNRGRDAV